MNEKKEYLGRDVNAAIAAACADLGVDSTDLDVDVLETGSTGLFGFGRKSARIQAAVKDQGGGQPADPFGVEEVFAADTPGKRGGKTVEKPVEKAVEKTAAQTAAAEEEAQASAGDVALVHDELLKLVELMGFPSTVEISTSGTTVDAVLHGEFEEELIGDNGRVVDSLQYLLRKIVGRRSSVRLRVNVDVGDWRARRLADLRRQALELAERVRSGGDSGVLEGLNPAERREVHLLIQEEEGVDSRSVGNGMFKKVLICRPGSGGRSGRRGRGSRNR